MLPPHPKPTVSSAAAPSSDNPSLLFVAGVHGVGKTTFCRELFDHIQARPVSASELIRRARQEPASPDKRNTDLDGNQAALLQELSKEVSRGGRIALDGHFCILNPENGIQDIPLDIYQKIRPRGILVLTESPEVIGARLTQRDGPVYPLSLIQKFQERELSAAHTMAKQLDVPVRVVAGGHMEPELIATVQEWLEA